MKKFMFFAVAALLCAGMVASANAQPIIRVGGGLIFDNSVPGGGAAIDIPLSGKPYGVSISSEYYKKSGVTQMPVRVVVQYRTPASDQADFYIGAGSGLYYFKVSGGGSQTKALGTAVAGINFKASESFGIYGETSYDRALAKHYKNNFSARVGVSFGIKK